MAQQRFIPEARGEMDKTKYRQLFQNKVVMFKESTGGQGGVLERGLMGAGLSSLRD